MGPARPLHLARHPSRLTRMTPTHDNYSGYDTFWDTAEHPTRTPRPADPADAYAAFAAAAEGA